MNPRPLRQPIAVGGKQVVGQVPDLVEIKLGPGMGIKHRRVVDVFGVLIDQGRNGKFLHIDIGAHQSDQLRRNVFDNSGLQAVAVHQHRDFHRTAFGQLRDETSVGDVAVDHRRLAGDHRIDDLAGVFVRFLQLHRVGRFQGGGFFFPARDLFDTAFRVFIQGDAEFLDQIGAVAFDEPRGVFGEMLGGFGDEITEAGEHFVTDFVRAAWVPMRRFREAAFAVTL